jgi:AcrR family transcriptional regulator
MANDETPELNPTLARLWDLQQPTARGPQPTMTIERIVEVAIAIADAEGLGALSMRRVAAELGAGTMSLYRYVRDKDELVMLMVDTVMAEDPFPDPAPDGWRERLEIASHRLWAIGARHSWVPQLISMTRPLMSPNGMTHTEWALAALDLTGLDSATITHMVLALTGYVVGAASQNAGELEASRRTGMTAEAWMEKNDAFFTHVIATGRFPMIATHFADDVETLPDAWFEDGLQSMLDGFERIIERRGRPQANPG